MIIIMLGAPGAGKGTVASILSEKLNIPQLSTGDIFRKHIQEKTELGRIAESYTSRGLLVPDDITIRLAKERLNQDDLKDGVILDGFPRTVHQAADLDKFLAEKGSKIDLALNLVTPDEEIIQRVVNRRVCPECKSVYNIVLNPPKVDGICDKCGHELQIRKDDNEETIKERIRTYYEITEPVINYYESKGVIRTEQITEKLNRFGKDVAEDVVNYLKNR